MTRAKAPHPPPRSRRRSPLWRGSRDAGTAHLLAAALLLPLGTAAALAGDRLYLALALEAAALLVLAQRAGMRSVAAVGHALFAAAATWYVLRLDVAGVAGTVRALADVALIVLALVASGQLVAPRERRFYRFAVHAALLALFWREFSLLPHGAAWVSAAWCVYGLGLLVSGLRMRVEVLQKTALATLVLLVAKLFVIDLAALEAIWRILLFLGLGGTFLLISYLLQGLWEERARVAGRTG